MNAQRQPEEPQCDEEATRAAIREAKRRRMLERSEQACRAGAVQRDPEFVAAIDAKLEELADAMAAVPEGEGKKARRAIKAAQARVREIEQQLAELRQEEANQRRLYGDAADRIIAMKARGEDVDAVEAETADFARDEHGAVIRHKTGSRRRMPVLVYDRGLRAKRLTGIEHALSNDHLVGGPMNPAKLYRTGLAYREAFEIAEGQTSSGGEGGGVGGGPKAPQPRLIEAGEDLADIRKALTPRQRKVLDMVCGLDMRIREAAAAMRAGVPATERALRGGLAAAADSLALARQRRADVGEERVVLRLRHAHRMIAKARG